MEQKPNKSNQPWLLYGYLAVIVFSVILVLVALPKMRQALHDSQMITLVSTYIAQSKTQTDTSHEIILEFPVPKNDGQFTYERFTLQSTAAVSTHEIMEALFAGPSKAVLSAGAVSFIPSGTRLIGLTISDQIAFIDVSKEFLQPTIWEQQHMLKKEQILRTLKSNVAVKDVVLLVEGALLQEITPKV